MIDKNWLENLNFNLFDGSRVNGLAGIGSQKVVLNVDAVNGEKHVIKMRNHQLWFHIKELPLYLTNQPQYDVNRLNKKLYNLIDNPLLDTMCSQYDKLFSIILKIIFKHKVPGLIMAIQTPESIETIPFILQTPPIYRRLQEVASLKLEDQDQYDFLSINGEEYRIDGTKRNLVEWSQESLTSIKRLWQVDKNILPQEFFKNPIIVWGAAIMDGFFTDDEIPVAVEFIEKKFGRIPKHPKLMTFLSQADAIAHLIAQLLDYNDEVTKFVKFCSKLGLKFQVHDLKGNLVANGFKL